MGQYVLPHTTKFHSPDANYVVHYIMVDKFTYFCDTVTP
jgi:hypothetical protein